MMKNTFLFVLTLFLILTATLAAEETKTMPKPHIKKKEDHHSAHMMDKGKGI